MTGALQGKTIVITGAASGIGYGLLGAAVAQGAVAFGVDFSAEGAERINSLGAHALLADVRDADQLREAIQSARKTSGRLDGFVSNAGVTATAPFLEAEVSLWEDLWRTNQRSVLVGCQAAAQIMVEDGRGGALVNVASVHASASDRGYEAYAGTKAAIVAMGRAMAWSLGASGIRVNTLSPGLTWTERVAEVGRDPTLFSEFRSWHADGNIATIEEVAKVGVFLLSDASAALTGTELVVDKGTLARLCNVGS